MSNIAIIPARGGSKRIPRKNIKNFLGKPIIAYSIGAAIESGIFDEIMVSTDDQEIAKIARNYGATTPFLRSNKTSGDYATISDVLKEVLNFYISKEIYFDYMCCILPTAPLLEHKDLVKSFKQLENSDFSTIIAITPFSYPIFRSFELGKENELSYVWPEYIKSRSQDLPNTYHDAGMFYWNKVQKWLNNEIKRSGYIVPEIRVQDIDTDEDWEMAELKYKLLHNNK